MPIVLWFFGCLSVYVICTDKDKIEDELKFGYFAIVSIVAVVYIILKIAF